MESHDLRSPHCPRAGSFRLEKIRDLEFCGGSGWLLACQERGRLHLRSSQCNQAIWVHDSAVCWVELDRLIELGVDVPEMRSTHDNVEIDQLFLGSQLT